MTRPPAPHREGRHRHDEDGFILLESIVAISLMAVILAALGGFMLRSLTATAELRARQAAVQVATSATELVDSVQPTDLVTNRDTSSVSSQFTAASAAVQPYLATMTQAYDSSASSGAGGTATIPTSTQARTLNGVVFSVNTYLGTCVMAAASTSCSTTSTTGVTYYRAVVAVTWSNRGCTRSPCTYVTSTLVNADSDPVFSSTVVPVAAPVITNPGAQVSTIGSTVSLTLAVTGGASPLTWSITSGSLPTGLGLSVGGVVSGTPTALTSATSVTVQVADAFGRTDLATFTWSVVARPTITTPGAQTATVGVATSYTPTYTCPNTPCTFVLSGAPAGLTINASTGVVSGTPTTPGTSTGVVVTITDASGISASTSAFTWRIVPRPTISDPGTRNVTIGQTLAVPITYSCPTTNCTVTLSGTVPGLGLSNSASTTGNNTTTSLSVSGSATTIYVVGTVQGSAVSTGTSKIWSPALTITDGNSTTATSATGTWTAYAAPTVGSPGSRTTTVRSTPNVGLAWTCPVSSCTIAVSGTVPGVGLSTTGGSTTANNTTSLTVSGASGTIYYTGLIATSAAASNSSTTYTPTITITDADGVTASASGTWVVTSGPALTNPGTQAMEAGQSVSLQMNAACPNTCSSWSAAYAVSGQSTYYALTISSTGKITAGSAAQGTYTLRVTVTDSAGQTDTVYFTLKVVSAMTITVPNQTTAKPSSGTTTATVDASSLVSPQAQGYTYSLSGAPSWLSIDPTTGLMTAIVTPSSTSDPSITILVTSNASPTSTASTTFAWNVS